MDIPVFKITIDDEYAKPGEELAISKIAYTVKPAIELKGMNFNNQKTNKMMFTDNVKMRIAGPIMVPKQIYRFDEEDNFEYLVEFDIPVIEQLYHKLMADLNNKDLFNVEHTEEQVPAYILEALLIDSKNKIKLIKQEYNIDVPMGSVFIVTQVTDKDYYNKLVENEQTGFSIEGLLGMKMSKIIKRKKENMKKSKFAGKKRFNASKFESDEQLTVVIEGDEIAVGNDAVVIDENLEVIEDYTGDVVIEGETVHLEDGTITEVKEEETFNKGKKRFNASKFESDELLTVVTEGDEIAVGIDAVVIDENLEVIEDYTGDVVIEGETVHLEDGTITEVKDETVNTDTETELEKEEKFETEEVKEEMKLQVDSVAVLEIVQPLIDELIERIAKLESELEVAKSEETKEVVEMKMSLAERLKFGSQFKNQK